LNQNLGLKQKVDDNMKKITTFYTMKEKKEKITMLTAYEKTSACIAELCGVDVILIGDSLGMVVHGKKTTIDVSINDIISHGKAVRIGAVDTFLIADMPYMSYHLDINSTKQNAAKLMIQTGANAVKLEGASVSRIDAVKAIIDCEIPVCGHLGLTPQSINLFGDYEVQGKNEKTQDKIFQEALSLEKAGVFMLVLECIPEGLGKKITENVSIPTIGIGAGRYTDGQVMVWHDILGLSDIQPKFVKKYIDLKQIIKESVLEYIHDVRDDRFPKKENVYYPVKKIEK